MKALVIASLSVSTLLAGTALAAADEPKSSTPSLEAKGGEMVLLQGSGPFTSIQAIKTYDASTQGSQRKVTFVDGKVVQDLFGFGPAEHTEYFLCQDGRYWHVCSDVYSRSRAWDSPLLSHAVFQGADTLIYLDGTVYKSPTAPLKQVVHITTCTGDSSPTMWGPYPYHRVTNWATTTFGTIINRTCSTP